VLILKETGRVIGECGLVWQEVDGVAEIEIGYHLRRELWGLGLTTEAARACRDYGFNQLGCDRLICLIHPDNLASRPVAEKNGMKLIREMEWQGRPTCVYAIAQGRGTV